MDRDKWKREILGQRDTEQRYKWEEDTREREIWIGKYKEETYGKERAIQMIKGMIEYVV